MIPLLDRLRERKLVQWALAYLAGAWLLFQVLHTLSQTYGWPSALMRSVPVLLAIGLLVALVLAWYHGEKGRQRVSGPELLMLSGILVVGAVAVAFVGRRPLADSPRTVATGSPGAAALRPELAPAERSIAVLPLTNLSGDPEDEYFSDGITDEIITTLSGIHDLRVISRTSVMRYKDTEKSLREIADELGVTHVLVGSGQRDGERVRIRAQLIDAGTDTNVWAERYDRPLEDIFAVQSEIAEQIARALRANLTPADEARLQRPRTANLLAHEYVLRAREFIYRYNLRDNDAGLELLRQARELDSTYPDAYAVLSQAFTGRYWLVGNRRLLDSAVVAGQRAIALDSTLALGYRNLGWALDHRGNPEAAMEAHLQALRLNPGFSDGLANLHHFSFGSLDEAVRWWRPALETDPTNPNHFWHAGRGYLSLGMTARARELLERSIAFEPEFGWAHYHLALVSLQEGKHEEARAQIRQMLAITREHPRSLALAGLAAMAMQDFHSARAYFERGLSEAPSFERLHGSMGLVWILQQSGEVERAQVLVDRVAREFEQFWGGQPRRPQDFVNLARIRLLQGDREDAIRQMDTAVRQGWRVLHEEENPPILDSLRGDPRYDRLIAEVEADIARMRERVERQGW
jgi:TolB-like protein/Flp pilus assembly protein TadD